MARCAVCLSRIPYEHKGKSKKLNSFSLIYPKFFIDPSDLKEYLYDHTMECKFCGYVAPNLAEPFTKVTVQMLENDRFSWNEDFEKDFTLSRSYRMAVCSKQNECYYTAIKWFIITGYLCKNNELRNKYYREALLLIRKEMCESHRLKDFELRITFISLLRMLQMFDSCIEDIERCKKEINEDKKYHCDILDINILDNMRILAEEKNSDYFTFAQILNMEKKTDNP